MNVHMLVGVPASDLLDGKGTPVVAGCLDHVVWEHCDEETLEGLWSAMKERMDPGGGYYEWREVVVLMRELDVMDAFKTTTVQGTVTEFCPKCGTTGGECPLGEHEMCPFDSDAASASQNKETS